MRTRPDETATPDGGAATTPLRPGRGRRPAAQVREAVLVAAGDLLFERGIGAVTFDKVASRSGASKMTLYRWWPSPGALALEAYSTRVRPTLTFADTGDIARDLTAQLTAFIHLLTDDGGGTVVGQLVGAAQSDQDLAQAFTAAYIKPRRQLAVERLTVAVQAGQIRDDVDLEVIVDQLWGACYHRLLLPALPLTPEFGRALVENVLRGVAPAQR